MDAYIHSGKDFRKVRGMGMKRAIKFKLKNGKVVTIRPLRADDYDAFAKFNKDFANQLEKNPPVTRDMIRAMFMQMGRKPSEADINRVMATMQPKK